MKRAMLLAAACLAGGLTLTACSTTPSSDSDRVSLNRESHESLDQMYQADPGLHDFLSNADAYVVFPTVGKGGLGLGGAYGHGEVFEHGRFIGYADLSQATIGAEIGGQQYSEVVAFESQGALDRFKAGQTTLNANASAVALKSGAAATAKYTDGIAAFVKPTGGLMLEADVGGQSFTYAPASAPPSGMAGADENAQ